MVAPAALRRHPFLSFGVLAAGVLLASRAVVASAAFRVRPEIVGMAVTVDLTVFLTALFVATVVRARALPPVTAVAVFLAGATVAASLLPPGARPLASGIRALAAPADLLLAGWLAVRAGRVRRRLRAIGDALPFEDAFRRAVRDAIGPYRTADAIAAEVSLLSLALAPRRRAPHVPAGAVPFTTHLRCGQGAVLAALALAGVAETLAAHVLLAHWSARWAWIATGFAIYSFVWLLGDWRGLALRPTLLRADRLHVRIGVRWQAEIPLRAIRMVCAGPDARGHPRAAIASPLGAPNLYLHLGAPVELEGLLGLRRRGEVVGLRVDEPDRLRAALVERCGPGTARVR
ncbi:MAG TPA: hypothetical protein VF841_00270 [Anaeromyxobacter sp.]